MTRDASMAGISFESSKGDICRLPGVSMFCIESRVIEARWVLVHPGIVPGGRRHCIGIAGA